MVLQIQNYKLFGSEIVGCKTVNLIKHNLCSNGMETSIAEQNLLVYIQGRPPGHTRMTTYSS